MRLGALSLGGLGVGGLCLGLGLDLGLGLCLGAIYETNTKKFYGYAKF